MTFRLKFITWGQYTVRYFAENIVISQNFLDFAHFYKLFPISLSPKFPWNRGIFLDLASLSVIDILWAYHLQITRWQPNTMLFVSEICITDTGTVGKYFLLLDSSHYQILATSLYFSHVIRKRGRSANIVQQGFYDTCCSEKTQTRKMCHSIFIILRTLTIPCFKMPKKVKNLCFLNRHCP